MAIPRVDKYGFVSRLWARGSNRIDEASLLDLLADADLEKDRICGIDIEVPLTPSTCEKPIHRTRLDIFLHLIVTKYEHYKKMVSLTGLYAYSLVIHIIRPLLPFLPFIQYPIAQYLPTQSLSHVASSQLQDHLSL